MKELIESAKKALDDNNFQAALFIALSLPDICGKLETPEVKNGPRAKRWFQENLKSKYFPDNAYEAMLSVVPDYISRLLPEQVEALKQEPALVTFRPENYWALRNAVLHEASDITTLQKVHLTHSGAHMIMINGALQLSVINFTNDVCDAVTLWAERVKGNKEVLERINTRAQIKNQILNGLVMFG